MRRDPAGERSAIEAALLEYQRSPGKHTIAGRQPPLLFASITEILQLASGRSPQGLEAPAPAPGVRGAAGFFIRSALLFPDADHYALLGLERGADTAAVKDRYRLMMRLVHPDFSRSLAAGQKWPADAASRLNQAYEVLSSPDQRRGYDEQLGGASPSRPRDEVRPPRSFESAPQRPSRDAQHSLKRLATGFGAAGAIAALALLYASMTGERESLVQRAIRDTAIVASLPGARGASSPAPAATAELLIPPTVAKAPAAPTAVAPAQVQAPPPAPAVAIAAISPPSPAVAPSAVLGPPILASPPAVLAPPALAPQAASGAAEIPVAPAPPQPVRAAPAVASAAPEKSLQLAGPPAATASVPPVPDARPRLNPGVTLAEVHPLLSNLLQRMESGSGDQVLGLLDRDARVAPPAQALLRDFDKLVDGGYPVKVANVQFKSEPKEGRLLVTGRVMLQVGSPPQAGKPFAVHAEFASREGTVVMTRLAPALER